MKQKENVKQFYIWPTFNYHSMLYILSSLFCFLSIFLIRFQIKKLFVSQPLYHSITSQLCTFNNGEEE